MSGVILVFLILFALQTVTGYWWWVLVVPFLYGAFRAKRPVACFASSAAGAGLLWLIGAVFALLTDSYRIATQVAVLGGIENPLVTVAAAALVAAVAGGVAGLAGFHVMDVVGRRIRLRNIQISHPLPRSAERHDRRRSKGKDQKDQAIAVPGRRGHSRTKR